MTVLGVGTSSSLTIQSLVDMRTQLGDLQRQLGTGKRSDSYSGLGSNRGLMVGMRSRLSAVSGFQDAIGQVGIRLTVAQNALAGIDSVSHTVKTMALTSTYVLTGNNQTTDQKTAWSRLDQVVNLLNSQSGDRYLFSGRSVDQEAVETTEHIIDGDGARAGLKQVIAERQQADLGTSGLGRLVVSAPTATSVALTEDAAPSTFGFKLASVTTNITGASVAGPVGSPAAVSVDLVANATAGQTVQFSFALPDGTTQDLTLTATTSTTPGPNEFTIGASAAATAANLQSAITPALTKLAGSTLAAASAVAAGNDFFGSDPPKRVSGTPLGSATALVDGTPTNTVRWYTGETGSDAPRSTAVVRADQSLTMAYGMRANEDALRTTMQSIAVFAATTFSISDPNASDSYDALKTRVATGLMGAPNQQQITDIESDLASVQTGLAAAKDRHQQSVSMLLDFMEQVEGVPQEQVAAQILALQTSLQATLQTTALLLQTNLLKYM